MTIAAPTATEFFVRGRAVAKGSVVVRHVHGQRTVNERTGKPTCSCRNYPVPVADAKLDEWTRLLATAAKRAMGQRMPFAGPVRVTLTFYYARPKGHTRAQRLQQYVIARNGDGDKLARACWDAFTLAAVWHDDSQAMSGPIDKLYCDEGEVPGVVVKLEELR